MSPKGAAIVAPSILAADAGRLAEEVRAVEAAGANWIHVDVMDGHFVPNMSFGPATVAALRGNSESTLDVHLMVARPEAVIARFADAGADIITIHIEATAHAHRALQMIRDHGCRAGVALNPGTAPDALAYVADVLDLVCVMGVNPGFGGQAMIASVPGKIAEIGRLLEGRNVLIEADGGVDANTAPALREAGTDVLVAGSAVFGKADYGSAIAAVRGNP